MGELGGREGRKRTQPVWTTILKVAGYVLILASIAFVLFVVSVALNLKNLLAGGAIGFMAARTVGAAEAVAYLAVGISFASVGFALGLALVISARSARPTAKFSRLKLWAKLSLLFGLEIALATPVFLYGSVLLGITVMHDPTTGEVVPWDGDLLLMVLRLAAVPVLIGIGAISVSLIWGRRKPPPDFSAVFG